MIYKLYYFTDCFGQSDNSVLDLTTYNAHGVTPVIFLDTLIIHVIVIIYIMLQMAIKMCVLYYVVILNMMKVGKCNIHHFRDR